MAAKSDVTGSIPIVAHPPGEMVNCIGCLGNKGFIVVPGIVYGKPSTQSMYIIKVCHNQKNLCRAIVKM
ncbi:hypothetical protein ACTXT7_006018 [Hymenolepis weldensis]